MAHPAYHRRRYEVLPNVVAVHDAGQTDNGDLYLTMEFLPRGTLVERIASSGVAAPREVLAWGIALAGALETAHRAGVIHRDVKPANVLFSAMRTPKLVDFGIARMRYAFQTQSGSVTATFSHATPEILAGKPSSPQSDVYSLASVLFYALSGRGPFDRPDEESLAPLIARVVGADPPDLREHGVPTPLAAVIERGLDKDPGDRFGSAAELGEALQGAAAEIGEPVAALPISNANQSPRSRSRRPRLSAARRLRLRSSPPASVSLCPRSRRRRSARAAPSASRRSSSPAWC
jgi:serine/threonine protein kinase